MKKIITLAALFTLVAFSAQAQIKSGKQKTDKGNPMRNAFKITDQQKQDVKRLNETFRANAEAIKQNSSLSKKEKKDKLRDLEEKRDRNLDLILTKEQQRQMKEQQEERKMKTGRY